MKRNNGDENARKTSWKTSAPPLPPDAPLLSLDDVGLYLRLSTAAVRKLIDGRAEGDDQLGELLRSWLVKLSPHRRYIKRQPFLKWLNERAGIESPCPQNTSEFPPHDRPSA